MNKIGKYFPKLNSKKMNLLSEIADNYGDFHDALITNFEYNSGFKFEDHSCGKGQIKITLSCFNRNKEFKDSNELITITCSDISYLNMREYGAMIIQALLIKNKDEYTLDFYPELLSKSGNGLIAKEKLDSDLIIKCKIIEYRIEK
ncbi:hypothetical protein [Dokdonia sp. Dokd-P16]|uniref:hypothetical protein n=1 Tax=Dokdonia sp. Dokd-P16 TaxID=2173169 RepID=UPI0013A5B33C|nr:hypothetical protein [Dokdonia sp. Dokd-P16]